MTSFRADAGPRRRVALLAAAVGLAAFCLADSAPGRAVAQTVAQSSGQGSGPIQLFQLQQIPQAPSSGSPSQGGTAQGVPQGGFGGQSGLGGGAGLGGPLDGAEVPEGLGLWTREDGGLGHGLWRGSRRETVATLLERLSGGVDSPTLRTLALRALLSEAETPGRSLRPVAAADGAAGQNLLVLRGEALLALGEAAYLGALLDLVAGEAAGAPAVLKLKTQANLLTGDYGRACASARDGVARAPADSFWTKAQVACQAASGEADAALLGLDLLRESGEGADQGFSALAAAALGYGKAPADPAPTPLNVALVLGSDLAPPVGWQDSRDPAVLAMAARDGDLARDRRLALAERAAAAGAITADELTGFFESTRPGEAELAEAGQRAGRLPGPQARALLFLAARQSQGAARADLARQALESARADGVELGVARLFAPLVGDLQPSAALTGVAPSAARALYLAGRYEQAGAWVEELRRSAGVNPLARQALVEIWPFARLAGADVPGGPQNLSSWREARLAAGAAPEAVALDTITLRGLLYALGESDSLSFGELIGSEPAGSMIGTSTLLALEQAAAGGRLGEAILLATVVIAENGVGGHPYPTAKAVEALNRVDRPGEARALAMEAAVARGL